MAAITYFLKLGHNNHGLIFTVVTLGLLLAVETVGLLWAVETIWCIYFHVNHMSKLVRLFAIEISNFLQIRMQNSRWFLQIDAWDQKVVIWIYCLRRLSMTTVKAYILPFRHYDCFTKCSPTHFSESWHKTLRVSIYWFHQIILPSVARSTPYLQDVILSNLRFILMVSR